MICADYGAESNAEYGAESNFYPLARTKIETLLNTEKYFVVINKS